MPSTSLSESETSRKPHQCITGYALFFSKPNIHMLWCNKWGPYMSTLDASSMSTFLAPNRFQIFWRSTNQSGQISHARWVSVMYTIYIRWCHMTHTKILYIGWLQNKPYWSPKYLLNLILKPTGFWEEFWTAEAHQVHQLISSIDQLIALTTGCKT